MKFSTIIRLHVVVFSLVSISSAFPSILAVRARRPNTSLRPHAIAITSTPALSKNNLSLPRHATKSASALSMIHSNKLSCFTKHTILSLRGGLIKKAPPPKTCLVGNISAAWKALLTESGAAWQRAEAAFRISDLIFISCLAFLPEYLLKFVNDAIVNKTVRRNHPMEFEDTPYLAPIATLLCQVGQLASGVYFGELFIVFLSGLGVPHLADKPRLFATLVYSVYLMKIVSSLKNRLLERSFRKLTANTQRQTSSRKLLYSRALDATIYIIGTLLFLDANNIDVGVALKSLLTVGGISSVVIGFALKEPVTEIIQGTSVLLSNKFITGDTIRLSDGTCGKVQRFEWTDVTMQGDDNSFVRIPHSQLAKNRIVNLSRMPCSQVSQEITLTNRGTAKIEQVLQDIKSEIRANCGAELMDEETQPFLVHWTDFVKPDSVVIKIQCHFRIPRLSPEYWKNREQVLIAVNRAVEKYNS